MSKKHHDVADLADVALTKPSGFRWFIRRYSGAYREMALLRDASIIKIILVLWGTWIFFGVLNFGMRVITGQAARVIGIGLAAVILLANIVLIAWWMGYRRSDRRLVHQLRGRTDAVAVGREIGQRLSGKAVAAKAGTVRPVFTDRAKQHRGYAIAPIMFPDQVREGLDAILEANWQAGVATSVDDEIAVCAYVADHFERVATEQ